MKKYPIRVCCIITVTVMAALLPGCAIFHRADDSAAPATAEAREHAAVLPQSRISTESWAKRYEELSKRAKSGAHPLVFIGDSITHGWEGSGQEVWAEYYAPRNALNIGIGGDRTQHVLWRLQNGNFEGQKPELCVLMIGTNNFRDNTAEEIAGGIEAIVREIAKQSPESKVLILAIFPRFEHPHPKRDMLSEASRIASGLADGKKVYYLDIGNKFLDADGTLPEDVMPDFLHPNKKGYRIWAEAIEATLRQLLDE